MTLDELMAREGIRHTMASYNLAGDRLREDDFIAVFTEDAVLESDGVPESDAFRYEGHKEIRDWLARWKHQPDEDAAPTPQATFIRHHLATSLIEFTGPETAKARTYWMAYTDIGADHCGYYLDVFRKTGERWLIAHRRVRLDWRSPESLFTSEVSRTKAKVK